MAAGDTSTESHSPLLIQAQSSPRPRHSTSSSIHSDFDTTMDSRPPWESFRLSEKWHELRKHHHGWSRSRLMLTYVACVAVILIIVHSFSDTVFLRGGSHSRNFRVSQSLPFREANAEPQPVHLRGINSKYAFATFLVGSERKPEAGQDHYLTATRMLTYQLLYAPETRSRDRSIPFLVLVTNLVDEVSRKRLRDDGAIVIEVPAISAERVAPDSPAWDHVMTKFRLWEFVDFERIAFLDADTVLIQPLDGVFQDPAAAEQTTNSTRSKELDGLVRAPETFVFAGNAENTKTHQFPPSENHRDWYNKDYLNAGFFVLKPDIQLLKHYLSYLKTPESFNPGLPEQNLMNEVHRRGGDMPWLQLNTTWNVHYPTMEDVNLGVKSIHDKWWEGSSLELSCHMRKWKVRMEAFYAGKEWKDD